MWQAGRQCPHQPASAFAVTMNVAINTIADARFAGRLIEAISFVGHKKCDAQYIASDFDRHSSLRLEST